MFYYYYCYNKCNMHNRFFLMIVSSHFSCI
jgi:hypothetical protein